MVQDASQTLPAAAAVASACEREGAYSCNLCFRYTVLLSNFRRYFKLASYISTHTNQSIVIAMGVPSLRVRAQTRPMGSGLCILMTVLTRC